jgi:UDP-N-acetyl-D-galactosamine dehydrogenase
LHKSKELGYDPQVILSGRRVNDAMPAFIAKKMVQMLIQKGKNPRNAKVLIKGITFKENVADIRNSKVADVARELMDYSVHVHLADPFASPNEVAHEYKMTLVDQISDDYDAVIVAVAHNDYKNLTMDYFAGIMKEDPIVFDLKALYGYPSADSGMTYWRL